MLFIVLHPLPKDEAVTPYSGKRAGLQLFTLATQKLKKNWKLTYKDNSSSCFDNLQHYSN